MDSGWCLSSSDEEDEQSLLPSSLPGKLFASPSHIQKKQMPPKHKLNVTHSNSLEKVNSRKRTYPSEVVEKSKNKKSLCQISSDPVKVWSSGFPHYWFLTTCTGVNKKFNYLSSSKPNSHLASMGIQDILSSQFGSLKQSAQFNYCIDIKWLLDQYPHDFRNKPLLIVHGEQGSSNTELQAAASQFLNIQLCRVSLPPYGTHHTKMMLLLYESGLRIVISTANLVPKDWNQKSQGFYMSPIFPIRSKTLNKDHNLKLDLISYISSYKKKELDQWVKIIEESDMSCAGNIRLVGSIPGRHSGASLSSWGHMRLRSLLKKEVKPLTFDWPVIGQFSSIGSLGADESKWLCNEWLSSLSSCGSTQGLSSLRSSSPLKLIFPTVENVRCSLEGYAAGSSLPYSYKNALKQSWLLPYLYQWKADHVGRSFASPHIKSYTRISPGPSNIQAAWFLLTSANLSKAAWGALEKKETQLSIRSYELGVLFFPLSSEPSHHHHVNQQNDCGSFFAVNSDSETFNNFFFPFSLPLTPYASSDSPWTWNSPHTDAPDCYGNVWDPC